MNKMLVIALAVLLVLGLGYLVYSKMATSTEGMADESDTMKYARMAELFESSKNGINRGMNDRNSEMFSHGLA